MQNASRILLSIYSKHKVRLVTSINSDWDLEFEIESDFMTFWMYDFSSKIEKDFSSKVRRKNGMGKGKGVHGQIFFFHFQSQFLSIKV